MVAVDYALIVVLGLSTVISLFRGFFKEAISLGTWVVALWVAWQFGPELADQRKRIIVAEMAFGEVRIVFNQTGIGRAGTEVNFGLVKLFF